MRKPIQPRQTFATIQGREVDSVAVFFDSWPEETYTAAGVEVTSVIEEDECILHLMSEDEIEELEQRLHADLSADAGDYEDMRGDYLRDLQKDERHEQA